MRTLNLLDGVVQVTASSPVCRNTDPKAVVSRKFLRMNFAGPSTVDGQPQTWWQVNLGEQHSLTCNYYTLRHDGSQDYVRNWVMQVSIAFAYQACPCMLPCSWNCLEVLSGLSFLAVHLRHEARLVRVCCMTSLCKSTYPHVIELICTSQSHCL